MQDKYLPDFIGIGAAKSATTWLFRCLEEHPDIFIPPAKELHYFVDYLYDPGQISTYQNHFRERGQEKIGGEISTDYLADKSAAQNIKTVLPDVKLFVCLRNPIAQIYSHYWHLLSQNFHAWDTNHWNFEEALERYPDKLQEEALYFKQLSRWYVLFKKEQIFVLLYDDIKSNPLQIVQQLYAFLGVEESFIPASLERKDVSVRSGASPKSQEAGKRYANIYQNLVEKIYLPLKNKIGERTANKIKDVLQVRQIMQKIFFKPGYPKMNPDTHEYLKGFFSEDVKKLSTLINRDLSDWLK